MAISTRLSARITGTFKDWLKDYLRNSSVAGCAYYVTSGRPSKERIFWLVVHVTSIIFIVIMTMKATIAYSSNPTVTTVETDKYPVQEIPFPGVAICNVNKISRGAALNLAEIIFDSLPRQSTGNFTVQNLMEMVKYLGYMYLFEFDETEKNEIELFHKLLIQRSRSNSYDDIYEKLRPPCHTIVKKISWSGRELCDGYSFTERKTGDGICCTFNYVRRNDDFGSKKVQEQTWEAEQVTHSNIVGSRFGFTVFLENDFHDHYYKTLPILGYKILIFSPLDYPDVYSGSLREVIVSPGTEAFLTLQATTLHSHPDVSMYRENERDCRFSGELAQIFEGYYSYSDCLMYCRLLDIIDRCGCLPSFYPIPSQLENVRICDLMDLRCLNEHRSKYRVDLNGAEIRCIPINCRRFKRFSDRWWSVVPRLEKLTVPYVQEDDDPEGSKSSLNCSECLPACSDVNYDVSISSARISATRAPFGTSVQNIEGNTIVHIFFQRTGVVKLRQDVLFYWYELMSNYGGICGFFLGISIIGLVEFLYFFTLRLYKRPRKRDSRFTFIRAARPRHRSLYWEEMVQPNFKY